VVRVRDAVRALREEQAQDAGLAPGAAQRVLPERHAVWVQGVLLEQHAALEQDVRLELHAELAPAAVLCVPPVLRARLA
jgi:hypothetical protein